MANKKLSRAIHPSAQYQEFTESGTWVHPEPGVLYAGFVEVIGGGGGGGGGRCTVQANNNAITNYGGRGGQGGDVHRAQFFTLEDQDVVVGAGGTGGNGGTVTNTIGTSSGLAGTNGGLSRFGTMIAAGGAGGASGSSSETLEFHLFIDYQSVDIGLASYVNVRGANGDSSTSGAQSATGGKGGTGWKGAGGVGGYGVAVGYDGASNAIAEDGYPADPATYGAGGGGGGGAVLASTTWSGRAAAGGNGADGNDGIVRVWYWRVAE